MADLLDQYEGLDETTLNDMVSSNVCVYVCLNKTVSIAALGRTE